MSYETYETEKGFKWAEKRTLRMRGQKHPATDAHLVAQIVNGLRGFNIKPSEDFKDGAKLYLKLNDIQPDYAPWP